LHIKTPQTVRCVLEADTDLRGADVVNDGPGDAPDGWGWAMFIPVANTFTGCQGKRKHNTKPLGVDPVTQSRFHTLHNQYVLQSFASLAEPGARTCTHQPHSSKAIMSP
jgi:hypothetical protein